MAHPLGTEYLYFSKDKDANGKYKDPYYAWLLGHERDDNGKPTGRLHIAVHPPGEMVRAPAATPLAEKETDYERPFAMVLDTSHPTQQEIPELHKSMEQLRKAQESLVTLSQQIDSLKKPVNEIGGRLQEQQATIDSLKKRIDELEHDHKETKSKKKPDAT